MIKTIILTLSMTLTLIGSVLSQNLIGYTKKEVKEYIAANVPNFELMGERPGVGLIYKVYNDDEQGRIFLIDENDLCYSYQMAFGYDKFNGVYSDLSRDFTKVNDLEWHDYTEPITFKLNIIRESSFFIVQRSIHKIN